MLAGVNVEIGMVARKVARAQEWNTVLQGGFAWEAIGEEKAQSARQRARVGNMSRQINIVPDPGRNFRSHEEH
jgi:hypothetical protein